MVLRFAKLWSLVDSRVSASMLPRRRQETDYKPEEVWDLLQAPTLATVDMERSRRLCGYFQGHYCLSDIR